MKTRTLLMFAAITALAGSLSISAPQVPAKQDVPAFEVASIRQVQVPAVTVAPEATTACATGMTDVNPRRLLVPQTTVYNLIAFGYLTAGVRCLMLEAESGLVGGPDWIKKDRFDVEGVIPAGTPVYTNAQVRRRDAPVLQTMMRTLLADRFKLSMHREMKEVAGYSLTLSKSMPKITPWKEGDQDFQRKDPEGNVYRGGASMTAMLVQGTGRVIKTVRFRKVQIGRTSFAIGTGDSFAESLTMELDKPVVDRTGLAGEYNIDIEYQEEGIERPVLTTALQELGFKLESTKIMKEVWVIDHIEKPSEN